MKFDNNKYKIYTWKHLPGLLWFLNPLAPISEILLGQRIPKVMLIDKVSDKPLVERQVVPCPHCSALHDGRLWGGSRHAGNWFGYYCPACSEIIPCMMSLGTRIVLLVTLPYWFWFKEPLERKWLAAQPARFENINFKDIREMDKPAVWAAAGFVWGTFMFFWNTPFDDGWPIIVFGMILWSYAGLGFAYVLRLWLMRKGNTKMSGHASRSSGEGQ